MSKRILLKIRYNGASFVGWQVQKNGRSVQETMQDALEKIYGSRPDVTGCSRTDSGVHAKGQCGHFDIDSDIPAEKFTFILPSSNFLNSKGPTLKSTNS